MTERPAPLSRANVEGALRALAERGGLGAPDVAQLLGASTRLIVYGSLQPGGSNHHELDGLGGTWRRGWIRGELLEAGWGADLGYPALRWDPEGGEVAAHLLESERLPGAWARLDAFEGGGYRRILVPFFEPSGEWCVGQVYAHAEGDAGS